MARIITHNDRNCLGFNKPITVGVKTEPLKTSILKENATELDFEEYKKHYHHLMMLDDDGREFREFHRYETDVKFFHVKNEVQPYARVRYGYYNNEIICVSCDNCTDIVIGKYRFELGNYEIGTIQVKDIGNGFTLKATVKDGKLLCKLRYKNGKDNDTEWYDVTDSTVEIDYRKSCVRAIEEIVKSISNWKCTDDLKAWIISRLEYTNTKAVWEI